MRSERKTWKLPPSGWETGGLVWSNDSTTKSLQVLIGSTFWWKFSSLWNSWIICVSFTPTVCGDHILLKFITGNANFEIHRNNSLEFVYPSPRISRWYDSPTHQKSPFVLQLLYMVTSIQPHNKRGDKGCSDSRGGEKSNTWFIWLNENINVLPENPTGENATG